MDTSCLVEREDQYRDVNYQALNNIYESRSYLIPKTLNCCFKHLLVPLFLAKYETETCPWWWIMSYGNHSSARLQTSFVLNWVWGTRLWYYLKVTQFWGSNEEWNKTSQQQKPNPPHYDFVKIKTKRPKNWQRLCSWWSWGQPCGPELTWKSDSQQLQGHGDVFRFLEHRACQ